MGATGHGSDRQRYEGVAGGGGYKATRLHVAKGGHGGWWRVAWWLFT